MTATATAPAPVAPIHYQPTGDARPRINRWHLVLLFTASLAVIVVIATIVVAKASPRRDGQICEPGRLCGGPPPGPGLLTSTKWESTGLGYSFEYNSEVLAVTREDANGVELKVDDRYAGRLTVTAVRAGSITREAMLDKEIARLGKTMLGLKSDTANATRIFGPTLGYIDGVGGSYRGTSNTPQSPNSPVTIVAVAATDGHLVAVVTFALEGADDPKVIRMFRGLVDGVAKTFRWGPIPE